MSDSDPESDSWPHLSDDTPALSSVSPGDASGSQQQMPASQTERVAIQCPLCRQGCTSCTATFLVRDIAQTVASSDSELGKKLGEMLTCPVCFSPFDDDAHRAYILSCGHTLCSACRNHMDIRVTSPNPYDALRRCIDDDNGVIMGALLTEVRRYMDEDNRRHFWKNLGSGMLLGTACGATSGSLFGEFLAIPKLEPVPPIITRCRAWGTVTGVVGSAMLSSMSANGLGWSKARVATQSVGAAVGAAAALCITTAITYRKSIQWKLSFSPHGPTSKISSRHSMYSLLLLGVGLAGAAAGSKIVLAWKPHGISSHRVQHWVTTAKEFAQLMRGVRMAHLELSKVRLGFVSMPAMTAGKEGDFAIRSLRKSVKILRFKMYINGMINLFGSLFMHTIIDADQAIKIYRNTSDRTPEERHELGEILWKMGVIRFLHRVRKELARHLLVHTLLNISFSSRLMFKPIKRPVLNAVWRQLFHWAPLVPLIAWALDEFVLEPILEKYLHEREIIRSQYMLIG